MNTTQLEERLAQLVRAKITQVSDQLAQDKGSNWTRDFLTRVAGQESKAIVEQASRIMLESLQDGKWHSRVISSQGGISLAVGGSSPVEIINVNYLICSTTYPCPVSQAGKRFFRDGYTNHAASIIRRARQDNPKCHVFIISFFAESHTNFSVDILFLPNEVALGFPATRSFPVDLLTAAERTALGLRQV